MVFHLLTFRKVLAKASITFEKTCSTYGLTSTGFPSISSFTFIVILKIRKYIKIVDNELENKLIAEPQKDNVGEKI